MFVYSSGIVVLNLHVKMLHAQFATNGSVQLRPNSSTYGCFFYGSLTVLLFHNVSVMCNESETLWSYTNDSWIRLLYLFCSIFLVV